MYYNTTLKNRDTSKKLYIIVLHGQKYNTKAYILRQIIGDRGQ